MTIQEFRTRGTEQFRSADFESPELETDFIVEEVTGLKTAEFYFRTSQVLSPEQEKKAEDFLRRRLADEPYQYIFGHAEFRDLSLKVRPGCLIPRPETEYLLDLVLPLLNRNAEVCEIGTGSGAISLSLGSERPDLEVYGSDLSPEAYKISCENLALLNLKNVHFFQGDLFQPFSRKKFDAVISNPPYIPECQRKNLPKNVREHEPDMALFAGTDGLDVIRCALTDAPDYLKPEGQLFFEIGEDQGQSCLDLCSADSRYAQAEIRKDQYGVDRFLFAKVH